MTLEERIAQLEEIALGAGNARKFTSLEGLAASALIVIEELQSKILTQLDVKAND